MALSEVTPAVSAGLPAPAAGGICRTFRTLEGARADNRDYLRVQVAPGG